MSFYRSRNTIQGWLDEFVALQYPIEGEIRVIDQDGSDGSNTGLVKVAMAHATTGAYIQPREIGSPWWVVTMEPREEPIELNASEVVSLASELSTISALCAFLEAKSTAYLQEDQD